MVKAMKVKGVEKRNDVQVIHPEVKVDMMTEDQAVTADMAREMIGWTEEEEGGEEFGEDYLLTDANGTKIRCTQNTRNRPLVEAWAKTLAQDILNHNWRFNGESIVIGNGGQVLSGQHRLVALILAEQMRLGAQKGHWSRLWKGPVTIESVVVFGVEESADVTRTLDNVRPRTFADVLFCDPSVFRGLPSNERVALCKALDHTVKMLWHRTGASNSAFSPKRTHSEAIDFLMRHQRVVKALQFIHSLTNPKGEEGAKSTNSFLVKTYISKGYAAALFYLMATSDTDGDAYRNQDRVSEKKVDFSNWDKAEEFWRELSVPGKHELRYALAEYTNKETGNGSPTRAERICLICKAWNFFAQGTPYKAEDLKLEDWMDEDGFRHLSEDVSVGGIDLGDPTSVEERPEDVAPAPDEEEMAGETPEDEPSEEEVQGVEERKTKMQQLKERAALRRAGKPVEDEPAADEIPDEIPDEEPEVAEVHQHRRK